MLIFILNALVCTNGYYRIGNSENSLQSYTTQCKEDILEVYDEIDKIPDIELKKVATIENQNKLKAVLLSGKKNNGNESYSYSASYVLKKMGYISFKNLLIIAKKLSIKEKDKINIFEFGDVLWIGFESRKISYMKDEK